MFDTHTKIIIIPLIVFGVQKYVEQIAGYKPPNPKTDISSRIMENNTLNFFILRNLNYIKWSMQTIVTIAIYVFIFSEKIAILVMFSILAVFALVMLIYITNWKTFIIRNNE